MSGEKKRRARVQGGWAAPTNVRSDRNKPKMPQGPAWLGKNIDQPVEKKFVYEKQPEDTKVVPPVKSISKAGVYELSTEPSGVSRLRLFPVFIDPKDADWMFEQLHMEIPWRQRSDVKNGVTYLQPRLTAWFGDLPYSYSGVTHEANPEWTPTLQIIKTKLEDTTGLEFNSMLANCYRDGHDSLAWHSDDEPALGSEPTIASLSFGDSRNFELRKKPPLEQQGDYTYMEHVRVPLTHGSLLIMEGATQQDWQHRIPREYHDKDSRINLTFRIIYPEP